MSELIENARRKKEVLKHLMLQLHQGTAPEPVRRQLARLMGEVPYDLVVEVEQELLAEGLPAEDILKFCDIHTDVLKGHISKAGSKAVPSGHPVHTFQQENLAVRWEIESLRSLFDQVTKAELPAETVENMRLRFNSLMDLEKHYQRKENLLFPYLEQHGITGPSKVMWAKDDEVRELLKASVEALRTDGALDSEGVGALIDLVFLPAINAVDDMIFREEQVLFPMSLDVLSEAEWVAIDRQSTAIGYCLYDPVEEWQPTIQLEPEAAAEDRIQLPSGSFTAAELTALLNSIPFDLTFVDNNDTVRFFTQGRERIFTRTRAILGRKVQLCHPPASVHVVEQILEDFRSGRQNRAPFWINLKGRFIHIEYFALRDRQGNYLGTLEVSQDLTEKRALEGEQRLLTYAVESADAK